MYNMHTLMLSRVAPGATRATYTSTVHPTTAYTTNIQRAPSDKGPTARTVAREQHAREETEKRRRTAQQFCQEKGQGVSWFVQHEPTHW